MNIGRKFGIGHVFDTGLMSSQFNIQNSLTLA